MDKPNIKNVKFDRKMERGQATYELYTADDAEKAKKFLLSKKVTRGFYYIEVKTPNGTWGIDKDGIYLVELLPWQKDLSLGECECQISSWPSMHAIMMASQGIMDNVVAEIRCGKCKHEWWDGIHLEKATIVRCPKCQTYNKTRGGQIHIHVAGV
jgi:ribosomal protein S27E